MENNFIRYYNALRLEKILTLYCTHVGTIAGTNGLILNIVIKTI